MSVSVRSSLIVLLTACQAVSAHVPYLESGDYSASEPFEVTDVDQSKALYGWLGAGDVDVFRIVLTEPATIYTHTLVPFCAEYRHFFVTHALTGPGLPPPEVSLPFRLPEGHGALVVTARTPVGKPRPTVDEPFSGRAYYSGPELEYEARQTGEYHMVVWSDDGTGDYVAVIGRAERFGPADIARAVRHTPTLRRSRELRGQCTVPAAE